MMRVTSVASAAALLAGCASFSPDGGMDSVSRLSEARTSHKAAWHRTPAESDAAESRVADLLAQPLTVENAVELALLNNRGLQASFADLGIAEADRVQAGRLKNPAFSFGRLAGGGVLEIDRSIVFSLVDLLTLPAATGVARQRFEQAQFQAALDAVGVAADTRRAWFEVVAAQQLAGYQSQVRDAAEGSADLARRMVVAGNFSKLEQMREQAFYADASTQLARAQHEATAKRERLIRLLGLWGAQAAAVRLPDRLPDLPSAPVEPKDAEQTAMDKRLDVLLAKHGAAATASALGLTIATRIVNALEVGYQNKAETGAPNENGYQLQVQVPLFDFGGARTARGEAQYLQAVNRTAEVAINARSEVREAYSAYRTTFDIARHYHDVVVPLRRRIADENLLRYNGMLIGVFELIADAREQVAGVTGYVEALRDYWIADADLQTALTGRSPTANAAASLAATGR